MPDRLPPNPGFVPELLALLPLSVGEVLICDGPGLAQAYRLRNPTARITAIGRAAPSAVDRVIEGPVARLTPADLGGPYDLIAVNETLGCVEDPGALLRCLAAVLKPGGHLVTAYRNDAHWTRMQARMQGKPVARNALAAQAMDGLVRSAGLSMRRVRGKHGAVPEGAQAFVAGLKRLGQDCGIAAEDLRDRFTDGHYIAVAVRPVEGVRVPRPVRYHQIELATLMDVRTRVPATALAAEPALQVTTVHKDLRIPAFGPDGGVVLLQRPRISEPQRFVDFIAACQRQRSIVIIEYDDDPSLVARVLKREDVPEIYERNLTLAHGVQTSTERLAQSFGRWNPEVRAFANVALELPPLRAHRAGPTRIVFGALNRDNAAQMAERLAPAIAALPDAEFIVIHDRAFFDALPTTKKRFGKLLKYNDYLDLLGRCDICLMPLEGRPEELAKSDVKWVEAASRSAIAIASPAVYAGTIRHGENGFIAEDPADWSRLLIALANDPALRNRVAATAWGQVRDSRMMAQQVAERRDWYLDLMARRDDIHAATLRRSQALAEALARGT